MEASKECHCERIDTAKRDLHDAEVQMERASRDLEKAQGEIHDAVEHMRRAEAEVHDAECNHTVEVKVDCRSLEVRRGTYIVSAFKQLVGVAADRELDILKCGSFEPLDESQEITICGEEVFVSHVRTGGAS